MIWIIGTGTIALEYAKILDQLEHEFIAVGRSGKNADEFIEAGAKEVVPGGLNNYLAASPTTPQKVIVATNVDQLAEVTVSLLNFGIKRYFGGKTWILPSRRNYTRSSVSTS